jgi:hypothetical protein
MTKPELAASAKSTVKPACAPIGYETIIAITASVGVSAIKTYPPAEAPGSRNPDAAVVVAGSPGIAVARAWRDVGIDDRTSDDYAADETGPAITTTAELAPYHRTVISSAVATGKSMFSSPTKCLWRGVGGYRAGSEQSSNQSYSESEILHCVPHGNLPSVRGIQLPADCELFGVTWFLLLPSTRLSCKVQTRRWRKVVAPNV